MQIGVVAGGIPIALMCHVYQGISYDFGDFWRKINKFINFPVYCHVRLYNLELH